ncbi:RIMS binding protein isoform X2 [Brevipalpus obovatus]|uniref:RIMS binding protein isoform X2 n=1 Tax=Brevipalpus obovatus TaxID=246614 RepID=UPI003D9E633A
MLAMGRRDSFSSRRDDAHSKASVSSYKSKDLGKLMEKLQQDDEILEELDREAKRISVSNDHLDDSTTNAFASTSSKSHLEHSNSTRKSSIVNTSYSAAAAISSVSKPITTTTTTNTTSHYTSSMGTNFTSAIASNNTISSSNTIDKNPAASLTSKELDRLMEKLKHDNKILAELDQEVKRVSSSNINITTSSSGPTLLSSSLPTNISGHILGTSSLINQDRTLGVNTNSALGLSSGNPTSTKRLILPSSSLLAKESDPNSLAFQMQILPSHQKNQELRMAEDIVDSIEIPNRGRCKVFIARYSYDPFKQSPNENPEQELHLSAGDFVLGFGEMDDDGFYMGETLDGRRGLVPSNFVEKLTGEDLFEFQASVLYETRDGDESSASYPPEFYDAILNDAMAHTNFQHLIAPEDFHRMNDYVELAESTEIDEEDLSDPEKAQATATRDSVPPPKRLILERQFHKSILIGWLQPECPRNYIDCYQIYVDGVPKATIPSSERTKALIEGVDSAIPHRISVRAITPQGRASRDAACTVVIGKNVPFAPCCVKATNITSESSLISWLPCNSNFYHVVAVNSVEVKTVGPSIFKHLITGLAANTLYRVSVRAKPGKLLCSDEKNPKKLEMLTTFVDFRTLPKSLPEPPVDVQVDSGPQEGTLLITWLPVTLDQYGSSNGCPVTGYAVFAAHKKLAEIDSPTGDHALLDVAQIESFHKKAVTVRTKSGENLSSDSMPCQIPEDLLKFTAHRKLQARAHSDSESESEMNQLMNSVARRSKVFDPTPIDQIHGMRPHARNQPNIRHQPHQPHHYQQHSSQYNAPGQQHPHLNLSQHHQNMHHGQPGHLQQQPGHQQYSTQHPHPTQQSMMNNPLQQPNMSTMNRNIQNRQQQQHLGQMNHQGTHPNQPMTQQTGFQDSLAHDNRNLQNMNRMTIPSIAITKDTPSEGINPLESYSEDEYDAAMRNKMGRHVGPSPQPPHRSRQLSEYERSQYGQRGRAGQQRGVRWFMALYDYDPLTMSPNPDAADEELPFREGDLIKIYGDKDPDGFYRGELNGRHGFVPCNMVSEVQYDPETGAPYRPMSGSDPYAHLPVKKMVALYDYDPQELSPNPDAEVELAFNGGDIIFVYGDMDEDGFYQGEVNGVRGLVPSNFLTEAGDRHGTQMQQGRGRIGDNRQQTGANFMYNGPYQGPQQMPQYTGMRPQGQYNTQSMLQQQPGTYGNKQRPNSLNLYSPAKTGLQQQQHGLHQSQQQPQQQQQQQTSLNPFSSLFGAGKKIIEEATTPRAPGPGGQGLFGQPSHQQQQHQHQQQQQHQQHQQHQSNMMMGNQMGSSMNQMANQTGIGSGTSTGGLISNLMGSHNTLQSSQQQVHHPQQQSQQGRFGMTTTHQTGQQQQFYGPYGQQHSGTQKNTMTGMGMGQQQAQQGSSISGALGAIKSIFTI